MTFLLCLVLCQDLPDKLLHFNVDLIRRSSAVDLIGCISFVRLVGYSPDAYSVERLGLQMFRHGTVGLVEGV